MEIVKEIKTNRVGNPNWKKGVTGNPHGRPRAPEIDELREALELAKLKHNKTFLQHFVERAFSNDIVAIALAKKILPDRILNEGMTIQNIVQLFQKAKEPATNI